MLPCFYCFHEETETPPVETPEPEVVVEPDMRYGYDFNQYEAKQLKIKRGDTFGAILERNGIDYPEVYTILQAIKKVSVRKLQIGKPYTLLFSKDSVPTPKAFIIYHPDALAVMSFNCATASTGSRSINPFERLS